MPSARSMETPLGLFWHRGVYPCKRQSGYCHRKRPDAPLVPSLISSSQDGLGLLPVRNQLSIDQAVPRQNQAHKDRKPAKHSRHLLLIRSSGLTDHSVDQPDLIYDSSPPTRLLCWQGLLYLQYGVRPRHIYTTLTTPSLQRNRYISSLASARPLPFTPPETVPTILILSSSITSPYNIFDSLLSSTKDTFVLLLV